jgi:hypothetical protein
VFVIGKPFQTSLMFAGEARAYPSEAPIGCSTLWIILGEHHMVFPPQLTRKHWTSLKKLVRDKHSSLFYPTVGNKEKSFITMTAGRVKNAGKSNIWLPNISPRRHLFRSDDMSTNPTFVQPQPFSRILKWGMPVL